MAMSSNPTRVELDQQLEYYDTSAKRYGKATQAIKYVNAISASLAAILGILTPVPAFVPGLLAGIVALLAIVDQVSRPERNWRSKRLAAELLRSERTSFDALEGEYGNVGNPNALLAARMNRIRNAEVRDYFPEKVKAEQAANDKS